jgi:rRNA maturation endonuclease Nob1
MMKAQRLREARKARFASGHCTYCGRRRPEEGHKICPRCLERAAIRVRRHREAA